MPSDDLSHTPADRWPHIATLIANGGHITVGYVSPVDGAAIAADGQSLLATLVRRSGESLEELLRRLDHAIFLALNAGIHTNEIEGGHFVLAETRRNNR